MKIAKIFATGISGDIRSEFTVYNVKDVKTIKLTDQCKCYQFLGCEKGKAQAIYLHKTSDVFFRLIPDIEDIITIIEQEYSELSKAYQEKEKIYSSNPSIENKFEIEKTLTAAVMKWLEKHSLKPDFYESISSVQAHGIDDYFKKK